MFGRFSVTLVIVGIAVAIGLPVAAQQPPVFQSAHLYGGSGDQEGISVAAMAGTVYLGGYAWTQPSLRMARLSDADGSVVWWAASSTVSPWGLVIGPSGGPVVAGNVLPGECGAIDGYDGSEGKSVFATCGADGVQIACASILYYPGYRGCQQYVGLGQMARLSGPVYYAAGWAEQWGYGGHRYVVGRYDAAGAFLNALADPSTFSFGDGVAVDGDAVYVAGFRRNSSSHHDRELPFVVKLNEGITAETWRQTIVPAGSTERARFFGIAGGGGAVYAVGTWTLASGDDQHLTARFEAATGAVVWQQVFGGADTDLLEAVALQNGRVLAVGTTTGGGGGGGRDAVLMELDPDTGDVVFQELYCGALDEFYFGMAIDGDDLWIAGWTQSFATPEGNAVGSNDMLLVRYSLFVNSPPVASELDQTVDCAGAWGATVTLDGSASSDPDGDAITCTWTGPFPEGGGTVTGVNPTVTLPLGTSTITLVVNDGTEDSPPDTVTVTVAVGVLGFLPPRGALVVGGQPPEAPGNAFKLGRTLPLKLLTACGGTALCGPGMAPPRIVGLALGGTALDIGALDLDAGTANDDGVDFRVADGYWIYNLDTKGLSPGVYTITLQLMDQSRWVGSFVLR